MTSSARTANRSHRWDGSNFLDRELGWIPDGEFRVLRALFSYADANTRLCYPSQEILAKNCGCHQGTVSRRIKRLVEWGFIEIWRKGFSKSKTSTVYRFQKAIYWPRSRPGSCAGEDGIRAAASNEMRNNAYQQISKQTNEQTK